MFSVARARRIEAPTTMLDRRFRDHAAWWQTRIAGEGAGDASGASDDPDDFDDRERK